MVNGLLAVPARSCLLAVAVVVMLAGGSSAGVAGGKTAPVPSLAGTWNVVFTKPPCAVGCSDTWAFTPTGKDTYDISNSEGFRVLDFMVAPRASGVVSTTSCWTAPPVKNFRLPCG